MSSVYFHILPRHVSSFRLRHFTRNQTTRLDALFHPRDHVPFCVTPSFKQLEAVQEFQPVVHRLRVFASA